MSIDLKITNLKAFNKKLNKTLQDNRVKEYVTRGTMMVQNTAKESILKGGTGDDELNGGAGIDTFGLLEDSFALIAGSFNASSYDEYVFPVVLEKYLPFDFAYA